MRRVYSNLNRSSKPPARRLVQIQAPQKSKGQGSAFWNVAGGFTIAILLIGLIRLVVETDFLTIVANAALRLAGL